MTKIEATITFNCPGPPETGMHSITSKDIESISVSRSMVRALIICPVCKESHALILWSKENSNRSFSTALLTGRLLDVASELRAECTIATPIRSAYLKSLAYYVEQAAEALKE